ncbi:MAG TPA: D-2-hydroxyacid dehydrogenase [Bosea sp. (in: a-proteobacteria)]|jgi:phosphoglycerate dehydrogenase-like enzyme|uniref:D-2-hydroxyacid dehydrogenase n=1 Tax=Bosea sp. (in: a-proteobacteria) TaxID=1871050 RepID=UPI002E154563|nr:D-2-hydroxyacid dehydrogenase [Bosea sp. (in: a-proteobacteria)]
MQHTIFVTSPLDDDCVSRIRAAVPVGVDVVHDPELLPPTRYVADHKGIAGFSRSNDQQRRWREHLARATILWDFPGGPVSEGGGLSLAPQVQWVQTTSSGVGPLVSGYGLTASDVIVTTARGIHARPLAEFTMMALLLHVKRHAHLKAEQAAHRWERYCGESLAGRTLLVVGAGKVGAEIGRLARAFDMRVVSLVRHPHDDRCDELHADEVRGLDALDMAVAAADAVVLAAPHTPETEGMISRPVIARMKPGVAFVNVGRGQLVDEAALTEALQDGRIGFAALDVAQVEPLPAASPLWDLPNVLISPHSASTVAAENAAITDIFVHNIGKFFAGETSGMINVLDKMRMY